MTETNVTSVVTESSVETSEETDDVMMILHSTTASVGIVANLTVVVAFLNHKKFRRKIPNMFIINQVSDIYLFLKFWNPQIIHNYAYMPMVLSGI